MSQNIGSKDNMKPWSITKDRYIHFLKKTMNVYRTTTINNIYVVVKNNGDGKQKSLLKIVERLCEKMFQIKDKQHIIALISFQCQAINYAFLANAPKT